MPIQLPGEPSPPPPVHLRRPFEPGDFRVQQRYAAHQRQILRAAVSGTAEDLRRVRGTLRDLDRRLRQRLAVQDLTPVTLPSIQASVEEELRRTEAALREALRETGRSALRAGEAFVTQPLQVLGQGLGGSTVGLTAELVDIAAQHSADLIGFNRGGLSASMLRKVNTELSLAVMGARGGTEAVRNISKALGQGGNFTHQAERIVRTETLRIFSMGSQATAERMADTVELRKAWIWSKVSRAGHAVAQERYGPSGSPGPIPVREPFIVNGEPLMQPRDPAGSAANTINCTCFHVFVPRDFGKARAARIYERALRGLDLTRLAESRQEAA